METVFHMLQTFLIIIVPVVLIASVYFLGRIKPIGKFYATMFHIPGLLLHALASFLKPFDMQQKPNSTYPGLRTIVLLIAAVFAIVATNADGFLTLQALIALTDDSSFTISLPSSLSWLTLSQGWLLLLIPALSGMILLDTYFQVVPEEARIFNVPTDTKAKERFERFILSTFILSLVASIAFNALKPVYLIDSESALTWGLRIVVFLALGSLLPLVMALTIYIISAALAVLVHIILSIAWFLSVLVGSIFDFLAHRFLPDEETVWIQSEFQVQQFFIDTAPLIPPVPDANVNGSIPTKDQKPEEKQKPGVRRSLKLFEYKKQYLPSPDQSNSDSKNRISPSEDGMVSKPVKNAAPVSPAIESASVNGHAPTKRGSSKPRAKKAVSATPKPTASNKRGGRKKAITE